jgi:hypothetical protein
LPFGATTKGIAPPPPVRESAPPPPPAPLSAAFGSTMKGLAPSADMFGESSDMDDDIDVRESALPPPPVVASAETSGITAMHGLRENGEPAAAPTTDVATATEAASSVDTFATTALDIDIDVAPRTMDSVHDVPTDPGPVEAPLRSVGLPDEAAWGFPASIPPPPPSPRALDSDDEDSPATEPRPSLDSFARMAAEEAKSATQAELPSRPSAEDEELPPSGPGSQLATSDVEFTRPLPSQLAAELVAAPYDSDDNDATRPIVHAADLPRLSANPLVPRPAQPVGALPPVPAPIPVVVAFPPPKVGAVEHAPSVQISDDAVSSTETTVPRVSFAAQAALPRIPPPAPVPTDFDRTLRTRGRAGIESIAPATGSISPIASRPFSNRMVMGIAAAVFGIGTLALLLRPSTGSVVLTVGGPGGAAMQGVSIKVDGAERCTSTPCEVSDLSPGAHVLTASATGLSGSTEQTLNIERGEHAAHHIALEGQRIAAVTAPEANVKPAPVAAETKPAPTTLAAKEEAEPAVAKEAPAAPVAHAKAAVTHESTVSSAKASSNTSSAVKVAANSRPAAVAQKPAVASAAKAETSAPAKTSVASSSGSATLDLNSTPRAAVVVNGRPMGMTPLRGVHVQPGKQTIVFVHPELGRKIASANLAPGARTAVGVKF